MAESNAKKTSIKEFLNVAIASLNSKQEQLSRLTETYKKNGFELPKDFPDLSKLITPLAVRENDENEMQNLNNDSQEEKLNLKEPTIDESSLRQIENKLLEAERKAHSSLINPTFKAPPQIHVEHNGDNNFKEPVFVETDLSAAGKLMLEAHKLGIPIENLKFTPKRKHKTVLLTPDSETFQVRTVSQIIQTPDNTYIYGKSKRSELAASPMLLLPPKKEEVDCTPLTLLQSPEEPELELFHKVDDSVPLSEILKAPESPDLSDLIKSLQSKGLV